MIHTASLEDLQTRKFFEEKVNTTNKETILNHMYMPAGNVSIDMSGSCNRAKCFPNCIRYVPASLM